jgi:hypothetical protein
MEYFFSKFSWQVGNHNKPYITVSDQNTDLENLAIDSQVAFFKNLDC